MTAQVRWTVALLAGPIVLFAAFAGVFWRIGLFEFTGSEAAAKVVTERPTDDSPDRRGTSSQS